MNNFKSHKIFKLTNVFDFKGIMKNTFNGMELRKSVTS